MTEEVDLAQELKKWKERREGLMTQRAMEVGVTRLVDDAYCMTSALYVSPDKAEQAFDSESMEIPMEEAR